METKGRTIIINSELWSVSFPSVKAASKFFGLKTERIEKALASSSGYIGRREHQKMYVDEA